jgi:FdhD protein
MWRLNDDGQEPGPADDPVVCEADLTVAVEDVGSFTIMCTPTNVEALAVGFLFAEGFIDDMDDVAALAVGESPLAVAVRLDSPSGRAVGRNMIVTSSCGFCGARTIEKALESARSCDHSLTVAPAVLADAMQELSDRQEVFRATGGTHAAGVFAPDGGLVSFAEDIGRHNALDKAVGLCLMARRETRGCGAVLSGRVSLEMVLKAARAGIELLAAVSAPSSLAVEAAERYGMTLCGFVRPGRCNVYTCSERLAARE